MERPLVKNAADEEQVKEAARKEKYRRDVDLEDVKTLLGLPQGRRFIWRLLKQTKVFESVWSPSAQIHYNAGRQDFGHFIMGEVVKANPDALVQMMKESEEGVI